MGPASAYAAVLQTIENDIQDLLKTNPEIFSFSDTKAGFIDIRDFQTTGVIAFAKGLPFSKVNVGKQSIGTHGVQVKAEYLKNTRESIEKLVNKL